MLHPLIVLILCVVQVLVAFVVLTGFGAMWSGAQKRAKSGWGLTWLWAIGVVIALNLLDRVDDYLHAYGGWFCR